jgi:hypothetical protein
MKQWLSALAVLAVSHSALAQATVQQSRPEILILGTFHMANPGHDIHNTQADDVLSVRRQAQIADLVAILARFRPTKIAIESPVTSSRAAQQYAAYVAGTYQLSRDETNQIGYRLAKDLRLPTVYPVDEDGEFQYMRVRNYAVAHGLMEKFNAMEARAAARAQQQSRFLASHSIVETLEYINADSTAAQTIAGDYAFVQFGEPWEYAGSDLLTYWFQRNMRIYRNIQALATAPDDRILVIYGAGHLPWLRRAVLDEGTMRLRTLSELVAEHP